MSQQPFEPETFKANVRGALRDAPLRDALTHATNLLIRLRAEARRELPEFDAMRDRARDLRDGHLAALPKLLEQFETAVTARGGKVLRARTGAEACREIERICRAEDAGTIVKSKSMASEEINLTHALKVAGFDPVETDLGEYIVQLRDEKPSHIIGPALHLNSTKIAATFRDAHTQLSPERALTDRRALVREARAVLRNRFSEAKVGIVGANFLLADTGSMVLVTNEGNAELVANLPKTLIVLAGIEKMVSSFADAALFIRLLGRSASGQEMTAYTSIISGPATGKDQEGCERLHVILLDNGRGDLLGTDLQEILRCIRCGACLNHCPIYSAVGGQAYGSVYSGPMGAVLTPVMTNAQQAQDLPSASTFCGRCEAVCPVRIPLPGLMRTWRERAFQGSGKPNATNLALRIWSWAARDPRRYAGLIQLMSLGLRFWGRANPIRTLPGPGAAWTRWRDLPKPEGPSLQSQLRASRRG